MEKKNQKIIGLAVSGVLFLWLMLVMCVDSLIYQRSIGTIQILRLMAMSILIGGITYLRMRWDKKPFLIKLSYQVKRVIFAPIYLGITLLTCYRFGGPFEENGTDLMIVILAFVICFLVMGWIRGRAQKKKMGVYMEQLKEYQKKL